MFGSRGTQKVFSSFSCGEEGAVGNPSLESVIVNVFSHHYLFIFIFYFSIF